MFCIRPHAVFFVAFGYTINHPLARTPRFRSHAASVGISKDGKGSGARELAMHVRVEPWPGFQEIPA